VWDSAGLPDVAIKVDADQAALLDEPRAGSIRVSVTDSGAGLSPEQLAQICSEGVQFNANQLQAGGGSGLGLFISKGLVEAHGGTLVVTSEGLGKGATFTMELPLFRFDDDATAMGDSIRLKPLPSPRSVLRSASGRQVVPESSPASSKSVVHKERMGSINPTGPRRVLVIDDADSNRKLLMRVLTAKGFVCEGATNGQEGVDKFCDLQGKGDLVDAILMDFEMPVLDGPGATRKLRELGCECLIVGVTGNVLPQDIDHFKEQGANTVLAKPLNIEAFESFLRAFRPARRTVTPTPGPAGNPDGHEQA
jgi:Amt family ammonium transporter